MNFTLEQIQQALDAIPKNIDLGPGIAKGMLQGSSGNVEYSIHFGWNLFIARLCDTSWGAFNVTLMRAIRKLEAAGVDIAPILASAQIEDHHWRWLDKSLGYRGDCYKWFFLIAEGYPQAACLIYHPTASVTGSGDIFYVEYIATAPWNRENVVAERVFKGVGPKLLNFVVGYAEQQLKLTRGFSLHSLPQAVPFYQTKLGMTAHPMHDKGLLKFFEWVA